MNKLVVTVLLSLFPVLALADSTLSFAPPASDYSVVFLGNLFGVVDGVLHGTGSQIMGTMFAVFNSAVLAVGGIIIMYTLMVSTMNTAHEGQMLGQKWSSIWIPVRSTLGLALLIPKASGYCLMQIFVMWIVVQGIGAADKVWEAALGYLNRGGVIIQAQQSNPTANLTNPQSSGVPGGAMAILSGEVCMLGLQKQLESQRQTYLDMSQSNTNSSAAPCNATTLKSFCNTTIPDFISSVNVVTIQNDKLKNDPNAKDFEAKMPNFPKSSPFKDLNGICGIIKWKAIDGLGNASSLGVTGSQFKTAQMSRAIAIQQMYVDLGSVAQVMINNNPAITPTTTSSSTTSTTNNNYSLIAREQFGVPLTSGGTICNKYSDTCVIWGPLTSGSGVLFNGTEFQGAISDYNGIMTPTINLMNMANQSSNQTNTRAFINNATNQGWIMAGSYFFDLVALNGNAADTSAKTDTGTGLDSSTFGFNGVTSGTCNNGTYPLLCTWVGNSTTLLVQVQAALDGTYASAVNGVPVAGTAQPAPQLDTNSIASSSVVNTLASSSVYGFINNSMMMQVQGQPGLAPLQFANMIHFSVDPQTYYLKEQNFDCGSVKIVFFSFCLGRMMGNLFYNVIFRYIYNAFLAMFSQIINQVIMAFLMIPLQGMASIFQEGLQTVNAPGVNPIVALANMGVMYINFSANLWLMLLNLAVTSAIIPLFGLFIFALIALAMPLLLAWIGIMVSVGFTTAYYIPILPYMIFTFGTLAWMISVIEAMVAAPIVALGVTHPEGHDAFGKGEAAIMILMNIFLRPALMIIGYIAAIALCYVGVWLLNAGFDHAISYIQSSPSADPNACKTSAWGMCKSTWTGSYGSWEDPNLNNSMNAPGSGTATQTGVYQGTQYNDWAGIYAYFFSILIYTTMYLVIVQKSFTLISLLPDKVLRWIGGTPESIGQEATQWGEEVKTKTGEAGKATQDAQGQMGNKLGGYGQKALGGISKPGGSGKAKLSGENPQSEPPPEG
ncbi:type IVB secretion system protein DotA [Legionella maioricensis]|uniref:Type IVB secretion system protein DotA n=1 Tax=Legionella maioricensis TaxID=2896528 RepID=A0A9X2ICG7_9GAMM|nr:type IVB secretion system protein DotA [Legionella maioricensis]MCL9685206.1 type IVB secretion system protein DotA [Legionella maioricensis]MCL9688423.1 type IVB secretion system protein DotA [Legionella maioricensis]